MIVPAYNAQATIEACVRSLLDMRYGLGDVELVVVDNGSTDATPERLAQFGDRIRVVHETKRGPAAARNRGIREVTAEWIAFTDADCVVDQSWLAELVPPLADDAVGIAGGRIASVEPCNRIERFGELIHDHRAAMESYERPYAISSNWASRRSVLLEAGLFDEDLLRGSDADMGFRVHGLGYRFVYREGAVIRHHNQKTFSGLFREGVMHGFGGARIRAKQGDSPPARRSFSTHRRLARHAAGMISGRGGRFENLCWTVFDAGKALGELRAHSSRGSG